MVGATEPRSVADGLRERLVEALGNGWDIGSMLGELRALPPDRPERGSIAAEAVQSIVTGGSLANPRRWREIEALLAMADGAVPETEAWVRARTVAAATSLLGSLIDGRSIDVSDVSARIDALARGCPGDPVVAAYLSTAQTMLGVLTSIHADDTDALQATLGGLPSFGVNSPGPLAGAASEATSLLGMLSSSRRLSDEQLDREAERADGDRTGGIDAAMRHMAVSAAALMGGEETDLRRVNLGVDHARKAVERTETGDAHRVVHLTGLALAHLRRFELDPSTTGDLRAARDQLEEARTRAGGPGHPQWQMIGEMLSEVRRHLGDGTDVAAPAVEGLREHVWRVLAQDDLRDVRTSVRAAASDAVDVARRCLAAGDPVRAVTALDSGRGLALFAATATRSIGDLLDDVGNPGLSGRWRAAASEGEPAALPASLRREVLAALAGTDGDAWLDPPSPDRIGRALQAVDADAMAYLVPGDNGLTGYAVVVSAAGRAGYLALPNLAVEHYPEIGDYLASAARRDVTGEVPESLDDEFGVVLDRLCTWAWGAAMGPLIESYLVGLPEPPAGRTRRVLLVPMGDLARVPWQAARSGQGRYAIESIAVSQVASARMLCRSGELSRVAPTAGGLVVGDPDTGRAADALVHARVEAYAIRGSFYRGARYLGRRPDGTPSPSGDGSVEQVRRWITSEDPADGVVAHLACHGVVRATEDEPTAHLRLANGERLSAGDLVGLLAGHSDRAIGLVVLSACRTAGSAFGYDEAYSLGTALLAGGVRSVLCTQWNAPDVLLPALMYMVHHFHRGDGLPAWEALRRAQLWALDPSRRIPDGMPARLHRAARSGALGRALVWASVGHWGQ